MSALFIKMCNLKDTLMLSGLDIAAFVLSGIIHDYKHFGVNNAFLINS